ncbi:MAG: hypothetical protein ACYSWO_22275 [Planctomycetota bacterium]|jgi:hypothetical protein
MKHLLTVSCILAMLAVPCAAAQQAPAENKISLRVLYAGMPDTDRQKDFVSFLSRHFAKVESVDVMSFQPEQAAGSDVVILDKDGIQWRERGGNPLYEIGLPKSYNRATIALGTPGAFLYDRMRLKPRYR